MIPKKLKEDNPRKTFYKKRVKSWPGIIGKRFFDDGDIGGFFTVKKVWSCVEYCESALTPGFPMSHWFQHYTMEIKTDEGERLIVRKLPFDLKHCFDKEYPKKSKYFRSKDAES